jgi:hypothetical protein
VNKKRTGPIRVLVFPTCSEPGLEIVRALLDQPGLEIVGGSSLPPSQDPSSLILRHHVTIPWLGAGEFRDALMNILGDYRIQVVFPATDGLIAALSRTDMGDVVLVAPRPDITEICLSKLKTYERLQGVVPVPRIYQDDGEVELPAYAKPLEEAGMRGHMRVNDPEDLRIARKRDLLVTEFLPGEEYEVNCLSDLHGDLLYANIRRLGRRVGGHVLDSQTVLDPHMTTYVEAIAAGLRIEGPWFAQFKRNRQDRPVLIEVNARIGGGSGLNRFGGVNLPLLAVKLFTGQSIPKRIVSRQVAVTRSLKFYVNTESIDRVVWTWSSLTRSDGKVNPRAMACLFDLKNRGIRQHLIHPAEVDVRHFLKEEEIPCFFEEILPYGEEGQGGCVATLHRLYGDPSGRDVFVTDGTDPSPHEIREQLPAILVATPDTLEILGWERLA